MSSTNDVGEQVLYWACLAYLVFVAVLMYLSMHDGTGRIHRYRFDERGQVCENQTEPLKPCHE